MFKKTRKVLSLAALFTLICSQAFATVTYTTSEMTGPYSVGGKSKQVVGKMALTGTYATNGYTLSTKDFGMVNFQSVAVSADSGYVAYYNSVTGKVILYRTGAITPGTITSTFTGTAATISPTAALSAAPTITLTSGTAGSAVTYSGGAFYVSGGGTVTASTPAVTVTGAAYTPAGSVASSGAASAQSVLAEVTAGVTVTGVKVTFVCTGN